MRTDERGALQPATPVRYRPYLAPGGVRYQAEPPVCNDCGHEISILRQSRRFYDCWPLKGA